MSFPFHVVEKAWGRAGGGCEGCGKQLVWSNCGRSRRGCWEPHHILPETQGGGNSAANCAILCTGGGENCHLTAGHDGVYAQQGSFNRLSNNPLARGLAGATIGGKFGGPGGALLGGLIGLISAPDLTRD